MTPAEVDRLAHAAAALRPDWPLKSLQTGLTNFAHSQPHRSYPDTAHALVALALDPTTVNPGRLAENGPWWKAAPGHVPERKITMGTDAVLCPRCRRVEGPDGEHECRRAGDRPNLDLVRQEARLAATLAKGAYERAMGTRAEVGG